MATTTEQGGLAVQHTQTSRPCWLVLRFALGLVALLCICLLASWSAN